MNQLSSMLVPLETLSGWPAAANPSPLQVLGLLVGLPLVVIVIVAVITKVNRLMRVSRGEPLQVTDPMWVGGLDRPEIEGPRHDETVDNAREIAQADSGDQAATADRPGTDVGGAGARW